MLIYKILFLIYSKWLNPITSGNISYHDNIHCVHIWSTEIKIKTNFITNTKYFCFIKCKFLPLSFINIITSWATFTFCFRVGEAVGSESEEPCLKILYTKLLPSLGSLDHDPETISSNSKCNPKEEQSRKLFN